MYKAGDFVLEYSKIFINLTSLFLVLSITFVDKVSTARSIDVTFLLVAWSLWIISIFLGSKAVRALVQVAATQEANDFEQRILDYTENPKALEDMMNNGTLDIDTIYSPKIKSALKYQIIFFFAGTITIVIATLFNAFSGAPAALPAT